MRRRADKILENIRLLAPILILLFFVIVLFTAVAGFVCVIAGYAVKIPGLILIAIFVMAMMVYGLWPLLSLEE